ncbi:hypothetical protein BUALT_Bualt16G0092500 [Buddleja alternifolia]|uniref:GTD-binding domain-containing protein n=1 Tax=Buddleja alternifolia TaxID=168488 RepID=A0AAV6WAB4_9LAMI|nr:hypothetical protein BUALT_Bualt16G0092500 [Buddleja alternifolia]
MSEADIFALKETLYAQQHLLQQLYDELDAEREASATATTEALSVMLRLHREKAGVMIEAEQYKRLSEQKISHAEESIAVIQDIVYHQEIDITALNYQVQSYRYKLLSMGYVDHSVGDEAASTFKAVEDQTGRETDEEGSDSDKKSDNSVSSEISSYWEQIMELDSRVEEILGVNCTAYRTRGRGRPSSRSSVSSRISTEDVPESDLSNSTNNGVAVENPCSRGVVHDVFEAPKVDQNFDSLEKDEEKTDCGGRVGREEEVRLLLNEIKEKLYLLQDEIRSCEVTKSSPSNEPSLCPLAEKIWIWENGIVRSTSLWRLVRLSCDSASAYIVIFVLCFSRVKKILTMDLKRLFPYYV